ncbi:oxaloacetate decarboxylase subunit alpha [Streptococcus merionis]|uniref:Na+ transporting oxaloacetate decarboxylase alpha chain n=1 Tax=Streptococcus merionis TaxID=400065 RepID=A0A239SVU1_9STRE|nr:oxaloacetate decarboxylase subunit alpha [Streptococcus merionis]SNU88693.1 Na+ transporting oxaloacetate decarboxylase alpha chain [Streptococcus merionis]
MKQIRFTETVLRDAHQSLMATRLRTDEMLPIMAELDRAGYNALECWGGATFDASVRYLNEDPWERLRQFKKQAPNTPLQMLLRGQNLLGYRHYADDIVEKFIEAAVKNGMDIFRIFDALNDVRNLEASVKAVKKYGKHAQVTICYTTSPVHTIPYYQKLTKELVSLGADSLCIKDMAGILTPAAVRELIPALKEVTDLPIEIHTHATSGTAEMTYLSAVEVGADIIDTAISPLAGGTSQPATESLAVVLKELGYDTGLDDQALIAISDYFKPIKAKYIEEGILAPKIMGIEPQTLLYQVPGGMLSNLYAQLKQANAEHLYDDVLKEVPKVREDLGYPPLVTPMSQMVGTQAVFNVLTGQRYKMIPNEIKDYVRGKYGQSPAPISDEIKQTIIGDEEVITVRPADLLEPEFDHMKAELEGLAQSDEDVLICAMFPQLGKEFLEKKYNPESEVASAPSEGPIRIEAIM